MLHHIEINVSNLKQSFDFYQWLFSYLNYSLYQNWEKGFSFKKDTSYIVFVQTEKKYLDTKYHRKHTGLNHLAFLCEIETIHRLHQAAIDKGIKCLYEDRYPYADGPDHIALFIEDDDRIKLEFRNK